MRGRGGGAKESLLRTGWGRPVCINLVAQCCGDSCMVLQNTLSLMIDAASWPCSVASASSTPSCGLRFAEASSAMGSVYPSIQRPSSHFPPPPPSLSQPMSHHRSGNSSKDGGDRNDEDDDQWTGGSGGSGGTGGRGRGAAVAGGGAAPLAVASQQPVRAWCRCIDCCIG